MFKQFLAPNPIIEEVQKIVSLYVDKGLPLKVYPEAERLHELHGQTLDIADIVDVFLSIGSSAGVAFELSDSHEPRQSAKTPDEPEPLLPS